MSRREKSSEECNITDGLPEKDYGTRGLPEGGINFGEETIRHNTLIQG